mgnify:FL=1
MADNLINGVAVLQGDLVRPWSGRWTARVELDGAVSAGDRAELRMLGVDYTGTVREAGVIGGRGYALVVAGAGGLERAQEAQHYAGGVSVRLLLQDLLEGAGEALAATSAPDVLARVLPAWTRTAGPALDALDALVDYLGATWRTLPDGSVWVGADAWATTSDDWLLIGGDPGVGRVTIAADTATIAPGESLADGLRVRSVKHLVTPAQARTVLRLAA